MTGWTGNRKLDLALIGIVGFVIGLLGDHYWIGN